MHSLEQYLQRVREEYRYADRKAKTRLLNEARKRTRSSRKVLIGKLAHLPSGNPVKERGPRKPAYGSAVVVALVRVWEIFEYPCGQRLTSALRNEVERLRERQQPTQPQERR